MRIPSLISFADDLGQSSPGLLHSENGFVFILAVCTAVAGVITWWRGVWALLDHYIGDSVFGHVMCIVLGLMIILYIRFSGFKLANFFPNL